MLTRNSGLDLARVLAIFFVIAGHFFINTPAHTAIFEGPSMFLQGMARTLFLTNVPLFLIITGYLNLNKVISRKYYRNMVAVIISYIFISIITIFFLIYFKGEQHSLIHWILKITNFSAIAYGWYIEMWIGLFLLTPFLNILWHNIRTRRHKMILIATLYFLCAFPDMFNRYGVHLVPGYWEIIYPCAFYFIGAFIREYQLNFSKLKILIFILGCMLINPLFNLLFIRGHSMIQLAGSGNGIVGMPLSSAVFLLVYNIDLNSKPLRKVLRKISTLSLDMYLSSYMFDIAVYSFFITHFYKSQSQFGLYFFIIVPLVFIASFLFSFIKQKVFSFLHIPTK